MYSSWPTLRILDFDNCAKLFFCVVDAALPYISKIELATGVTDIFSSPFGTPESRPMIFNLNLYPFFEFSDLSAYPITSLGVEAERVAVPPVSSSLKSFTSSSEYAFAAANTGSEKNTSIYSF